MDVVGGHRHAARRPARRSRGEGPDRGARGRRDAAGVCRRPPRPARCSPRSVPGEPTISVDLTRAGSGAARSPTTLEVDVDVRAFAAEAFNTVFRVDAADGAAYALRVGPDVADPRRRMRGAGDGVGRGELRPLPGCPLSARSQLATARSWSPRCRSGACVLFEWVRVGRLREHATPARVHATGARARPAPRARRRRAVIEPSSAGGRAGGRPRALVPRPDPARRARARRYGSELVEAVDRAQETFDALWRDPPHPPHLLHGDIQPGNVMVDDDRITLIDFQDLIWGFEIQDVTIAIGARRFDAARRTSIPGRLRDGAAVAGG